MNNEEARALEIYITLIANNIRKENSMALNNLRAFFHGLAFRGTYDPDLLVITILNNIEVFDTIPTHLEITAMRWIKSHIIKFTRESIKPYYTRPIPSERSYNFSGRKISLRPKIKNPQFHEHLLTFFQEIAIMGRRLPV